MKSLTSVSITTAFFVLLGLGCSSPPSMGNTNGSGGNVSGGAAGSGSGGTKSGSGGSSGSGGAPAGSGGMANDAGPGTDVASGEMGGVDANPAGCPDGVKGHCNADTGPKDKYPGFTLALAEEFDQTIDLDTDPIWTWSDGGPKPDSQVQFQKNAITFQNGRMIITATAPAGGAPAKTSYAESAKCATTGTLGKMPVVAGEFRTKYNNYRYGRYEVKLKAPTENVGKNGDGNFLATLFAFRTPKWNFWNEIDIELEANIKGSVAYNTVNPATTGFEGYPPAGHTAGKVAMGAGFNVQQDHVYAFEWTMGNIAWYVDGTKINECTGGTCTKGDGTTPVPTKSAKIMLNLWVFNSAAAFGDPANNTYPFHSEYEYFRFYKWNTETTYPYDTPATQLPDDDLAFSQNNASETTYPQKTYGAKCPQ